MGKLTQTLVIDNFRGTMTPYVDGDINSGLTNIVEVFGHDPFTKAGNLTWYERAAQIDAAGSVITDMIVAGKVRVESGITYVYAIGHTGRLYKIQVNDPTTFNPNYDNPVLVATLAAETPTFTRGGFIDFYGTTEQIWVGHDKGVTRINFDGTGETFVGSTSSWTQNAPRPLRQFVGKLYVGNGTNIAEIDTTNLVVSYTKLSPGFPTGSQVRDLDVTPDGNYLQIVVAETALYDITSTATPSAVISPANSFVFSWNGSDTGATSVVTYAGATLSANLTFGDNEFLFGYDAYGGGVWGFSRKLLTSQPTSAFGEAPFPNAVFGNGNLAFWASILPFEGALEGLITMYGTFSDFEFERGYWSPLSMTAATPETDVRRIPFCLPVSNFAQGASTNGYTDQIFGESKAYFSTLETSSGTTKYRFYKWSVAPAALGTAQLGVYQTQNQIFSKKVKISEVRVYAEPWVANNSFTVDLIGSAGTPIAGASQTFTVGTNLTAGDDFAWYNPQCEPTFAVGLRITNLGTKNFVISKVELDVNIGGK